MAHHVQYSPGVVSVAIPVAPSRRKTIVQYGRTSSDSSADLASFNTYAIPMSHTQQRQQQQQQQQRSNSVSDHLPGLNNNNNKPPPVPRTSLIRSQTAADVIHHKAAAAAVVAAAAARQQANNRVLMTNNAPSSASAASGTHQQQQHNGTSISDVSARSVHQHQPLGSSSSAPIDASSPSPTGPAPLSRSFSVESASGIRRKIPVTPVLSTGPKSKPPVSNTSSNKNSSSSSSHSTLTYRHGTLVFGTASTQQKVANNSVVGRLRLDLGASGSSGVGGVGGGSVIMRQHGGGSSPGSPPSPAGNPFVLHPLLADHSLLNICQEGDAGELSRYLTLLQDRVPTRTANATDSSGKSGLHHAAMTGNVAIARLLVKLPNLDINRGDNEGNTALHLAAQAGHADAVSLLTLCPDLKIDQRNDAGLTALMKAALQGRVRCVRLLLLAGASPVLRDFGRRLCSAEWARLTGRTKCAEIIDNYMEKMQLNPGLSYRPPGVASSEPSLLNKRPSSLSLISTGKSKDSWVKSTLRKAAKFVGASTGSGKDFSIASQLAGSGVFGASVLLPDDSARRSSLPAFPERLIGTDSSSFQVPRIHVSYWNSPSGGGSLPPTPLRNAKPIPSESRPAMRSRARSPSPS